MNTGKQATIEMTIEIEADNLKGEILDAYNELNSYLGALQYEIELLLNTSACVMSESGLQNAIAKVISKRNEQIVSAVENVYQVTRKSWGCTDED